MKSSFLVGQIKYTYEEALAKFDVVPTLQEGEFLNFMNVLDIFI